MKRRIAFLIAVSLGGIAILFRTRAEAKPDAVSAASITVGSTAVTATTATVTFTKDKYNYGTRILCYDPAPAAPKNNCVTHTASGNSGSFAITGLKPSTAYNFSVKAVSTKASHSTYTSTGTFTTLKDPSTALNLPSGGRDRAVPGLSVDANGRERADAPRSPAFRARLPRR